MEKLLIEEKLKAGATIKQIALAVGSSQTNVRYYMKKFGLKARRGQGGKLPKDLQTPRRCACGETDPEKFYGHKTKICAICHNKYNHDKGREKRKYILDKLGKKCYNCKFDKHQTALDVHHIDPATKDVAFATHRYWTYERIDKEIANCILLCRNCHQAHHCGELKIDFGY